MEFFAAEDDSLLVQKHQKLQALGSLLPHVASKFRRQISQYCIGCIGTTGMSGYVRYSACVVGFEFHVTSLEITTCRLAC